MVKSIFPVSYTHLDVYKRQGIGLAEKAFELIVEIVKMTYELVRGCKCENGCPGCIYSSKWKNENNPLDKKATILVLEELLHKMEVKDK